MYSSANLWYYVDKPLIYPEIPCDLCAVNHWQMRLPRRAAGRSHNTEERMRNRFEKGKLGIGAPCAGRICDRQIYRHLF